MSPRSQKASVLVIVLVSIIFASAALLAFTERALDELILPSRAADATRLRPEAYSALETTLAVLVDFNRVNGGLRSPAEGWGDPLTWANYVPRENHTVTVRFEDESGKMSLPNVTQQNLADLFTYWDIDQAVAAKVTDGLFVWTKANYTPTTPGVASATDYASEPIPFKPPARSLRSWSELASIDGVREEFFDANGRLTDLGKRFQAAFSLYRFTSPNVNAANSAALATLAKLDDSAQQTIKEYLGAQTQNAGTTGAVVGPYFKTLADATKLISGSTLPGFGVTISALRVHVTVRQGPSIFTLSVLLTPTSGSATAVPAPAVTTSSTSGATSTTTTPATAATTLAQLNYPFTILEVSESDIDPATQPVQSSAAPGTETAAN